VWWRQGLGESGSRSTPGKKVIRKAPTISSQQTPGFGAGTGKRIVFRDQPQAKSLRPYPAITKEQKGSKHCSSDRGKHVALRSKSLLYKDQKRKNDTACGAPYENHR
jgi:hypothetical protein